MILDTASHPTPKFYTSQKKKKRSRLEKHSGNIDAKVPVN